MCKPRDIAFTGVHRQRRATGEGIAERRKLSKLEQGTAVAVDVIIRFMKCNPTHYSCRIYVLAEIFSRIFFHFSVLPWILKQQLWFLLSKVMIDRLFELASTIGGCNWIYQMIPTSLDNIYKHF